jgi:hypothetical protein
MGNFCEQGNQNNQDTGRIGNNSKALPGIHAGTRASRLGNACNFIFILQACNGAAAPQRHKSEARSFTSGNAQNTFTPPKPQACVCVYIRAHPHPKFLLDF